MVHFHLSEVFSLVTDSDLLMGLVLIDVNAHLVDSLGVFIDASIDSATYARKGKRQGKYDLLVRLLSCEYALVFRDVGRLDFDILPVVTVIYHISHLI